MPGHVASNAACQKTHSAYEQCIKDHWVTMPEARLIPGPSERTVTNRLVKAKHGSFLIPANDMYIGESLTHYGEWEEAVFDILRLAIEGTPPDVTAVAVDAGANLGAHSIAMAQLDATVHAFEVDRILFNYVTANTALNGLLNLHTYHKALSNVTGNVRVGVKNFKRVYNFGTESTFDLHGKYNTYAGFEVVEATTLDKVGQSWPRCDVIKIDVQGMDMEVLYGATATIKKHSPVVLIEAEDGSSREISNFFKSFNPASPYDCWSHISPLFRTENHNHNPENIFTVLNATSLKQGSIKSVNMVCFPAVYKAGGPMAKRYEPLVKFLQHRKYGTPVHEFGVSW